LAIKFRNPALAHRDLRTSPNRRNPDFAGRIIRHHAGIRSVAEFHPWPVNWANEPGSPGIKKTARREHWITRNEIRHDADNGRDASIAERLKI